MRVANILLRATSLLAAASSVVQAQSATFVYRLGKDTVAVEQFTRTAARLTGEVMNRQGVAVVRTQYDIGLAGDGRVTSATYKVFGGDGKPIAGRPREVRYEIAGDSATRTIVWADSTPTRVLAAKNAMAFAAPSYGMLELAVGAMRRSKMTTATFPIVGTGVGTSVPSVALAAASGDTVRLSNGLVLVVDKNGLLQGVDGLSTTQKMYATRSSGLVNVASLASTMKPTGVLSTRGTARAAFQTQQPGGVVMVDYGRPLVRERTVWGGLLVPLDTIWRLGANDATHFATGRDLTFGNVTVPAGLYTLFLFNAKSGPMLVVNKMTGQWGTVYDASKDLVRIPLAMSAVPEFTEEFTINVRQAAPNRGSLEFVWGSQMASAAFVVNER